MFMVSRRAGDGNCIFRCLARARQAGVTVPEVLWLGTVDTPAGPRTVMAQTAGNCGIRYSPRYAR